ncbi:RNA-directed DNA polymerase [Solicola gregarius]|uniref:RNA-directed DNA polymerase n=1 Tax=Solicola gregarius TaxID=2908642 RepID=A0AA46YM64_9ACTN|nr:RNA-directed DNA polymerase [Solicola gregarius]UYM06329.1 RNA-directed DNA polymerase [Solicola gregarius]
MAKWVRTRLETGHRNAPGLVVDARKAHQAFRPVPVVGIAERIAFRALTEWVVADLELTERSPEEYRSFVAGPIQHAFPQENLGMKLSDAQVEYVVHADIASYYQYVDHGVLLAELENRTGKVDAARLLIELLGEVQGTTYGLPQLLDPSDKLSEIYIQALERDVVRRLGAAWRYNDDFRLAVNGYGNAQQALEELSAAARPLGLVLNDRKSMILKFSTYFWRYAIGEAEEADVEINPTEIEVWVEDYPDLDSEGLLQTAGATFDQLSSGDEFQIDLTNASPDQVKDLRRAFNIASREQSPIGLPHVEQVFRFLPQLTPRLADYLVTMHDAERDADSVWDALVARSGAFNTWQRAWLTYVARRCAFLDTDRVTWIRGQFEDAPPGLLHAEAAIALALAGEMDFATLDTALRTQAEALAPWYAIAINHVTATAEQRSAVRGSSRLYELLISPPAGK